MYIRCFRSWSELRENLSVQESDSEDSSVLWDLPTGYGPAQGHDALQWANLAKPDGWLRVSCFVEGWWSDPAWWRDGGETLHLFLSLYFET